MSALDLVALDLETTGLSIANDRVIEIGAVRVSAGSVTEDTHATLVAPGIALPKVASTITGISEGDLKGAPDFGTAMANFARWARTQVVIGWSVGFDLGVLAREHRRHAIVWTAPRSLDLLHLVELLAPDLPNHALETVAAWLGVPVSVRHRAAADAETAARIFTALLPRLRAAGIITLAQAERATGGSLRRREDPQARSGWAPPRDPAAEPALYGRIDSFPFRHRAGDLMIAPAPEIAGDASMATALARITADRTGALIVRLPGGDGILTERDVIRAVARDGAAALKGKVADHASRPLESVQAGDHLYRALTAMRRKTIRHLGVNDAEGRVIGLLTTREVLAQRADDAVTLSDRIHEAATPAALGRVWADLVQVARALVEEEVDPRDIAAIISSELRGLTARAAELAEVAAGAPPSAYSLIVLGSGARGESLLAMDQDNAMIIADGAADGPWFESVGTAVADTLDTAGVPYCKGGIMASRPAWRKEVGAWRVQIAGWVHGGRPEDFLNADIFFDAAHAHGDATLTNGLLQAARNGAKVADVFLKFLALNAARLRAPLGLLGRIKTDGGRVDLKIGGIMPIFGAARALALRAGSAALSTPDRLAAAAEAGIAPAHLAADLADAHRILLGAILAQQLRDLPRGMAASNRVDLREVSRHEKEQIAWALGRIETVPDILGVPAN